MDEPCSALDPISTLAIEDLIAELKQDYTIVIVTHNMQQAARVSDQTAFFNLEATGKPGKLDRDRRHREDLLQPDAEGHGGLHLRPVRLGPAYGVSTTRVPDCSGLDHASATSASGRCLVWMCNSPAATIATSRGRPSLRAPLQHLERHTANADTDERDAVAAQESRRAG